MKKTLSTVLAVLMILSAFVLTTGVSVSAAALEVTHENEAALAAKDVPLENLTIKVDGNDCGLKTVQTLSDGTKTIRFTRNPSATFDVNTKNIVSDGWNVTGVGVTPAYRYLEVVYYYTVPEGSTPLSTKMILNPLGTWAGCGEASSESNIVANQWASAIIKLPDSVSSKTENMSQYHFYHHQALS